MYPHKQKTSESAHTLSADDAMQNLQLAATFIVRNHNLSIVAVI
jgi:hypothetical protein